MTTYEEYFESVQEQAYQISELIEQLILLDDLIALHQKHESKGLLLEQYLERRDSFKSELDRCLNSHRMKLVFV